MAPAALWIVAALAMLLHALVLPNGKWLRDEFEILAGFREHGLGGLGARLLGWSPRPFSEALLFAYGALATMRGAPLIGLALGAAWLLAMAPMLLAARLVGLSPLVPILLAAAALLLAGPSQMWFWPAGAFAYLPTFGGIAAACLLLLRPLGGAGRRLLLCLFLIMAATSSEVGAVAVAAIAASNLLLPAIAAREWPRGGWRPADVATWSAPLLVALGVCGILALARMGSASEAFAASPTLGSPGRSLLAALLEMPGMLTDPWQKLLVPLGFLGLLRAAPALPPERRLALLVTAGSLLGASFATLALSFFQFGQLCCTRHESVRNGLLALAWLLTLAAWAPRRWPASAAATAACLWAAAGGLGASLLLRAPSLAREMAQMPLTQEIRRANWDASRSDAPTLIHRTEPPGRISGSTGLAPGAWTLADPPEQGDTAGDRARSIMLYFRRPAIEIRP